MNTASRNILEVLLKRTSRSFYLTLRLLPSEVRHTISLGYLLARASDSIADAHKETVEARLELLRQLPENWPGSRSLGGLGDAENDLLDVLPIILKELSASPDRDEILQTWQIILEGQIFDLERFIDPVPLTKCELDRYIYLVAGCVGEFWTRVCFKRIPNYSRENLETMCLLGRDFGKGLQLVNILRDRHVDAESGRVYVPPERFDAEMKQAHHCLDAGRKYVAAVRSRRLRAACVLPLDIGRRTLDLIAENPQALRAKIPRSTIWAVLVRALLQGY